MENRFHMEEEYRFIRMGLTMMVIGLMDCNMGLEKRRIQLISIFIKASG